jgi:hypothetical protein
VFKEAYLHNINLYEELKGIRDARGHTSVLGLIKLRDLQSEGMNEFVRTFYEHRRLGSSDREAKFTAFKLTEQFRKRRNHFQEDESKKLTFTKKSMHNSIV